MVRHALVGAVSIVVAALWGRAARAASSIYYSPPENACGWCARYPSQQAHRCAERECKKQGGSRCRYAAGCTSYGAAAFAERPVSGFGAACFGSDASARQAALIGCIAASNADCWTDTAFTGGGRASSVDSNQQFDRTWFAELMLQTLRIYDGRTDGRLDAGTGAAIRTFQQRIGRTATGVPDADLVQRLFDAVGGPSDFARVIKRDLLPGLEKQIAESGAKNRFYSAAPRTGASRRPAP